MNVESTSGGEATAASATDGARAGSDVGNLRVAQPIGDGGADAGWMPSPPAFRMVLGLGTHAGQAPSPLASPSVGVGPRAKKEPHALEPPAVMALGPARHREERTVGQAVGPSVEAPMVEEIPREVPHPWEAPTRVS